MSVRVEEAAALVPEAFAASLARRPADGGPSGADWLAALPGTICSLLADWGLEVTGPAMTGWTAIVLPVRAGARRHVLKVVWPHPEARHEHLALRRWAGDGAVALAAADPARGGLLLEPLDPGGDLTPLWDEEACEVAGGLLRRLHVPALPQLPTLSGWARRQLARVEPATDVGDGGRAARRSGAEGLPPRMVARAAALAAGLAAEPDCDATLLHTDLHYGNVLRGSREPWLAIDPKPVAGHPGFEVAPLLWNRSEELGTGAALRYLVRRRVEVVCAAMGVAEEAARQWALVREWAEAMDAVARGDAARVTLAVALSKALDE